MNDMNSSSGAPRFFVTKSGFGFEEGVYLQEEIKSLPKEAHQYVISLAVAESLGYVILDHTTGKHINDLTTYSAPDTGTGLLRHLRGVNKGTIENHEEVTVKSPTKIGNALRDTLQTLKEKSVEDSLKAKIAAKKNELKSNKA